MKIEFNTEVQKLFLRMMCSQPELYTRVMSIMNPANFDRTLRDVAQFIVDHTSSYNTMPDPVQIKATCGVEIEIIPDLTEGHSEFFLENFEKFTKKQELERAIMKAADMIEKGEYDPVEKLIKDAVQVSLQSDLGTDYFADPMLRNNTYFSSGGQISTGWPQMDRILYGGFDKGTLNIFAGPSGCVTYDTMVEIIELPDIEIDFYAKGDIEKIKHLYKKCQPKQVPIGSLMDQTDKKTFLVSSPDGWVPVLDCIKKIKYHMFKIKFSNGTDIEASHDHLFQKADSTWWYTKDLKIGDTILSFVGQSTILEIEETNKKTPVYDLSVGHVNHRYYTAGICSHNSGKSLVMMNLALNWLESGLNGVYITMELGEEQTALRTDAMLTSMSTKDIRKHLEDSALKVRIASKKMGQYRIKRLPAQSNINAIRSYLSELKIQTGMKIDFIMVDYLDLMSAAGVKINPSDVFQKDKYVSEELRNFAIEQEIILVTASQINRSGIEDSEYSHASIAGGISKIYTGDNVFGIFTSRSLKERGKYLMQCLKARNSNGVDQKLELDYDVETMRITDSDPSEDEKQSNSVSSIMSQIKSKVTTTVSSSGEVTVEATDSPNVVADVQGAKLKSLLNSLKTKNEQ